MECKRCYDCKFWMLQDSGYSNYTVMETYVNCLKNVFEEVEESYSWEYGGKDPENDDVFFKQAENCKHFVKETGTQIALDVDGEITIEDFKEDLEVYEAGKDYGL